MDFSKTGEELLTELFNAANSTLNVPRSALTFGAAAVNDGADSATRNTKLALSTVPGSGFSGGLTITYNRIDLGTLGQGGEYSIDLVDGDLKISDLVARLNVTFKTGLRAGVDYTDANLPAIAQGSDDEVVLTALALSKVYRGTLTLTVRNPAEDISGATAGLDGFDLGDAE